MKDGQLTVSELIELLRKRPLNALVWLEGCDCYGKAIGVEYDTELDGVLVWREAGVDNNG